jgi:magnesium and cobalt transporter|tara:strand:+ start:10440 stop:11297 length:858 start_codon:yes stop_codon:yes gene_type:complete
VSGESPFSVEAGRGTLLQRLGHLLRGIPFTRGQLFSTLREARHRDLLDDDTLQMMRRVVEVSDLQVEQVMISRGQMVTVDANQQLQEVLPAITESAHSRFPVTDGDKDGVVGILLAKDLLHQLQRSDGEVLPWATLLRPAVFIPESKRLNVLLQEFRDSRNHMAIVVNEYGSVVGLITIEDVLEQIVGNIEDEHDIDGAAGMVLRRGSDFCVIKAMLPVDSFNHLFGVNLDPLEYDTMGGLVTGALGHVPRRGEMIDLEEITAEVLSADSRRPRLLRITRLPLSD